MANHKHNGKCVSFKICSVHMYVGVVWYVCRGDMCMFVCSMYMWGGWYVYVGVNGTYMCVVLCECLYMGQKETRGELWVSSSIVPYHYCCYYYYYILKQCIIIFETMFLAEVSIGLSQALSPPLNTGIMDAHSHN